MLSKRIFCFFVVFLNGIMFNVMIAYTYFDVYGISANSGDRTRYMLIAASYKIATI